jgi:hypothetical protein
MLALGEGYPTLIFVSAAAAWTSESLQQIPARTANAKNRRRIRYFAMPCLLFSKRTIPNPKFEARNPKTKPEFQK